MSLQDKSCILRTEKKSAPVADIFKQRPLLLLLPENGIPWLAANVGGTVVSAFVCRRTFGSSRQRMNCFRLGPIDSPFDGSASRKAPEEEEIGKGRKKGGKKFGNLSKWRYYRTGRLVTRLSSPFIAYVVHRFSLKPFLFFHLLS